MSKLLGIREVVGAGFAPDVQGYGRYPGSQARVASGRRVRGGVDDPSSFFGDLPAFMRRAQAVSIAGTGAVSNYEHAGTVERVFTPYDGIALGQAKEAFDLQRPGAVREIKQALIALAKDRSDALSGKWSPAQVAIEQTWKRLKADDVWNGDTAAEFALAISRYRQAFSLSGPYVQSTPVGPQPMARGMELIAGAVEEHLGGVPAMPLYLAWRSGTFAPPSSVSAPSPSAPVNASTNYGSSFLQLPTDMSKSDPQLVENIRAVEGQLEDAWRQALVAQNEPARLAFASHIDLLQAQRRALVGMLRTSLLKAGCTSPATWDEELAACLPPKKPECPGDMVYRSIDERCVCPLDTEPTSTPGECVPVQGGLSGVALMGLGAVVLGAYYLYGKNAGSSGGGDWTM